MIRSSNPALPENTFSNLGYSSRFDDTASGSMTIQGTAMKTIILILLASLSAGWMWLRFFKAGENAAPDVVWMMGGAVGGLVVAIVTAFKKEWAPVTAPIYALLQGLFIGGFSSVMEMSFPGIVIQAAMLTFGTLFAMLAAYRTGLIQPTQKFKLGVMAATGGIAILYLVSIVLSFFGIQLTVLFGSGWTGIVFSLIVVTIAALNFIIDFDFIEQGARMRVPAYMEWYGAFAMMVTLVWLYIEILNLLSKVRER